MAIYYKKIPVEKMNLKVKKKEAEIWTKILEVMRGGRIKDS